MTLGCTMYHFSIDIVLCSRAVFTLQDAQCQVMLIKSRHAIIVLHVFSPTRPEEHLQKSGGVAEHTVVDVVLLEEDRKCD